MPSTPASHPGCYTTSTLCSPCANGARAHPSTPLRSTPTSPRLLTRRSKLFTGRIDGFGRIAPNSCVCACGMCGNPSDPSVARIPGPHKSQVLTHPRSQKSEGVTHPRVPHVPGPHVTHGTSASVGVATLRVSSLRSQERYAALRARRVGNAS